jgi:DNA-directed RNA polymerase subunit alpha
MQELLLPSKIEITPGESANKATLTISPCFHGYGTTLSNALRRVLLSSLPGAAVTAIKINGVTHEFDALDGVKEDVLEIVLNLKSLRLRMHTDEPTRLTLKKKGKGVVKAKDIDANSEVEIANPDLEIATITDDKNVLEMEIFVAKGRGYDTVEERTKEKAELGVIVMDAVYTPVKEVGFRIENVRVGEITNYDKLIMDIETDGTISPEEAVDASVRILLDHFNLILNRGAAAE